MESMAIMFHTGAATHIGKVRQRNEDSYLIRPEIGIWGVADGMGGHEAGDVASRIVIEELGSIGAPSSGADLLRECEERIAAANTRLKEIGDERGGVIVGATIAVLLAFDGHYACLWAGDSRIYVVRGSKIVQLSQDHTEVEELLVKGVISREEAMTWKARNAVTRAIGVYDQVELEIMSGPMENGDSFVICSDGLTRHVANDEILHCVDSGLSQEACDNLIALTLERGATDNVTVIVVRFQPEVALDAASSGQSHPAPGGSG
jgi:protein phosphatase